MPGVIDEDARMPFQFACLGWRVVLSLPVNTPGALVTRPQGGTEMQLPQSSLPITQPVTGRRGKPTSSVGLVADKSRGALNPVLLCERGPRLRGKDELTRGHLALGFAGLTPPLLLLALLGCQAWPARVRANDAPMVDLRGPAPRIGLRLRESWKFECQRTDKFTTPQGQVIPVTGSILGDFENLHTVEDI